MLQNMFRPHSELSWTGPSAAGSGRPHRPRGMPDRAIASMTAPEAMAQSWTIRKSTPSRSSSASRASTSASRSNGLPATTASKPISSAISSMSRSKRACTPSISPGNVRLMSPSVAIRTPILPPPD